MISGISRAHHCRMLAVRIFGFSLLGLALMACAGATPTDLVDDAPPAGAATTSDTTATEPGGKTNGGTATPSPDPKDPSPTSPPKTDTPKDPQNPPTVACAIETEDNNSADKAVAFSGCMSGKLASRADQDFFKVVAPKGAKVMLIEHKETSGKVLYRITEEGEVVPILGTQMFTDEAPEIEVTGGSTYIFRLSIPSQGSGGQRSYEMNVKFE